jgi:hypothetical protein
MKTAINEKMKGQDLYVRLTDPTGRRKPVINAHRVWDRETFYMTQVKLHETPKDLQDKRLVSIATEADYLAARKVIS